jgi:hypothetical protein
MRCCIGRWRGQPRWGWWSPRPPRKGGRKPPRAAAVKNRVVSVVGERLCFARCRHHAPAEGSTQTISAMYWAAAATITSAWKISWNPNHRGHGSGRWRA